MNLRNAITRTITYTEVEVTNKEGVDKYVVYGKTTPKKELKKILNNIEGDEIPTITTNTITEKRALSLEDFIKASEVIEGEESELV